MGSTLNITLDRDANVSVSLYLAADAQLSLPNGFIPLSLSTSTGITLNITPPTAIVLDAHFTTPSFSLTSLIKLNPNLTVGFLKYDSELNWYNTMDIESYDLGTYQVTVNLPSAGTYVFAQFNTDALRPALYNIENKLKALVTYAYQYPNGFYISINSQGENTLKIQHSTVNPKNNGK